MSKHNVIIAGLSALALIVLGIISLLPKDNTVQTSFVGKRFVPTKQQIMDSKVTIDDTWYSTSEYAGRDTEFGNRHFLSGKTYTIPNLGVEETQDPWNYVNGDWFTWKSADGVTYSVRMKDGNVNGYKMNNSFKNVDLMYTPTFGLGVTRILELLILNGIFNTDIMPFIDKFGQQVKYFTEEEKPSDYYLLKTPIIVGKKDPSLVIYNDVKEVTNFSEKPVKPAFVAPAVYGIRIGETAPNFDMELLDGRKVKLSDYYGRKTIINFWATWCGICITEFPVINDAYVKNKNINILAVCSDGTTKQIQRIKDKYSMKYSCDFSMSSSIGTDRLYELKGFPTTYFLDESGVIKHIQIGGFENYQQIENILKSF